jgi:methionine-rich copper-binding protein CopC
MKSDRNDHIQSGSGQVGGGGGSLTMIANIDKLGARADTPPLFMSGASPHRAVIDGSHPMSLRESHPLATAALLLLLVLGLTACSSSDDGDSDTTAPDNTPPTITSVSPANGATDVSAFASVTVEFSEPMNQTEVHVSGDNVISGGFVSETEMEIYHEPWPGDATISITVDGMMEDNSGNDLGQDYTWTFTTETAIPSLVSTLPADGATGVALNAPIRLEFTRPMDASSFLGGATITASGGGAVAFAATDAGGGSVLLTPNAEMPVSTEITVAVSTSVMSADGYTLAAPITFTFTTGATADTTPPSLVDITPASGSTVAPGPVTITFSFDEAIDPNTFGPTELAAGLALLMGENGPEGTWSPDGTEMSITLPSTLRPGMALKATFSGYSDLAGNVNDTPTEYELTVSGTPDPWPMNDGERFWYVTESTETEPGGEPVINYFSDFVQMEDQGGGRVRWVYYQDEGFINDWGYDAYLRTSSAISQEGWYDGGVTPAESGTMSPPIELLRLPVAAGSWSGTTTVTIDGETVTGAYTVTVEGREDVNAAIPGANEDLVWYDCWRVRFQYTLTAGATPVGAGDETHWLAPGFGRVRIESTETDADGWTLDEVKDLVNVQF